MTQRLNRLVDHGILERRLYQSRPDRYEYRLTEKGLDLYPVIVGLMQWGDRWAIDQSGPPMTLTHKDCGHDGLPILACKGCGASIGPRDMRVRWSAGHPRERADSTA